MSSDPNGSCRAGARRFQQCRSVWERVFAALRAPPTGGELRATRKEAGAQPLFCSRGNRRSQTGSKPYPNRGKRSRSAGGEHLHPRRAVLILGRHPKKQAQGGRGNFFRRDGREQNLVGLPTSPSRHQQFFGDPRTPAMQRSTTPCRCQNDWSGRVPLRRQLLFLRTVVNNLTTARHLSTRRKGRRKGRPSWALSRT